MTIQEALDRLLALKQQHGNIQVEADCPHCGRSFPCGLVTIGPVTARLMQGVGLPEPSHQSLPLVPPRTNPRRPKVSR